MATTPHIYCDHCNDLLVREDGTWLSTRKSPPGMENSEFFAVDRVTCPKSPNGHEPRITSPLLDRLANLKGSWGYHAEQLIRTDDRYDGPPDPDREKQRLLSIGRASAYNDAARELGAVIEEIRQTLKKEGSA